MTRSLATQWVVEASAAIPAAGERPAHLHVATLKPIDAEAICRFCARFTRIVTVENHSTVGGLGSAVMECLVEGGVNRTVKRLGVPDMWAPGGTLAYIRHRLGLDVAGLVRSFGGES